VGSDTSLEEEMGEEAFRAAGLHKLSDDELAALEHWLAGRDDASEGAETEVAEDSGEDRRGLESAPERTPIETRIVGTFDGWRGRGTTFEFENGMVWRIVSDESFVTGEVENPKVEIRPAIFGTWRMHVEDYRTWARVERVR
ncbi:MAG: hypothetical protein ACOCSR_03165, partial [Wenzhouxiangella sp.]